MDAISKQGLGLVYVGIDLGGRKGKTTMISCLSSSKGRAIVDEIHQVPSNNDDYIVNFLKRGEVQIVAIDSPLQFPICARCALKDCPGVARCEVPITKEIVKMGGNPYTQRLAEIYLQKFEEIKPIQTMALGQIVSRAIHLLRRLKTEGFPLKKIIETYPKASLLCLSRVEGLNSEDFKKGVRNYKRKGEGARWRRLLMGYLQPRIDFSKFERDCAASHDKFDAVIAGFTAYLFDKGLTIEVPNEMFKQDGWIYLPNYERL